MTDLSAARLRLREQGFIVLHDQVDPAWLRAHRPALRDYVLRHMDGWDAESRSVGASATAPTFTLQGAPESVATFVTAPQLGAMAAALLDVPAVRLLHFCGFFKPAGGQPTPWHQDLDFIPLATDKVVTAWLPLVPIPPEMGGLVFAAGSHRDGHRPVADVDVLPNIAAGALQPGDISFHLGWTMHKSLANTTAAMREAMALCFYADGAPIGGATAMPFGAALRQQYFPGLQAGAAAIGPYTPVIYREDR